MKWLLNEHKEVVLIGMFMIFVLLVGIIVSIAEGC